MLMAGDTGLGAGIVAVGSDLDRLLALDVGAPARFWMLRRAPSLAPTSHWQAPGVAFGDGV